MSSPAPARPIGKAVILAAGLGTRFLPATKATPKEMLPVVDKPAIQYVVEEAAAAGLLDVLMVTGRNKRPLEDHFDRNHELEETLARKGDTSTLARVRESTSLATIHYVRQGNPGGVGHAVLCAARHVGDQPFAVLLGDDLIDPRDRLLSRMVDVRERLGGSVVALMEVDPARIRLYGCASVEPTEVADTVRVTSLVEKPDPAVLAWGGDPPKPPARAPGYHAVIGRFVLDPAVFGVLRQIRPGRGGELQLTDALSELAVRGGPGGPVHGVLFTGRRYDTGDRLDYLRAVVRLASEREDLGPEFRDWLRAFVAEEMQPLTGSQEDTVLS